MTQDRLFDVLQDWEKVTSRVPAHKVRGRNILSGQAHGSKYTTSQANSSFIRQKIMRTIQKAPEVMVKISGGGKNMCHIQAHMTYISRHGEVELEDELGYCHKGRDDLHDVHKMWSHGGIGVPKEGEKRREAFNIVLSMPPGTDRPSVLNAVRDFAQMQFKDHQYVFAAHNDEAHPHVHLCVKAVNRHGVRLNPRKGDLHVWRERFAEKLCEHGIAANATPRRARGIVQKAEKQVLRHIDRAYQQGKRSTPCFVRQAQRDNAAQEITLPNPAQAQIVAQRYRVQKAYGHVAQALAQGDQQDRELGVKMIYFARAMPPVMTKHESLVQLLKYKPDKIVDDVRFHQKSHDDHPSLERTR